jgi:putative hemolysin
VRFPELSLADVNDPPLKRGTIRLLEHLSGRDYFAPIYERWRGAVIPQGARVIRPLLDLIDVDLRVVARHWPPEFAADAPVVLIANHPFGILDGIAALTLAEDLGRPFRVLINKDLLKVPELQPFSLPIDFDETRSAQKTNLATREEAMRLLRLGTTIVVFPSGGVATANKPFGRAMELPWKPFVARLVQGARAAVIPVYFEGQCSPLFHLVSRFSMTLRLSMLIREFRRGVGRRLVAHVGTPVPFAALAHGDDRKALLGELYRQVQGLAPEDGPSR